MYSENLQRWALIAEIVGGFAVVLLLIFVGLEIRQSSFNTELNSRVTQVNAYQSLMDHLVEFNDLQTANTEYFEIENRLSQGGMLEASHFHHPT